MASRPRAVLPQAPPVLPPAPSVAEAPKREKPKPFSVEQHRSFAASLVVLAGDLKDMRSSVEGHYPATGEAARSCREMLRQFERLRAALNARFFSEGKSSDGMTPYYPPGGPVLTPPQTEDLGDGDADSEATGED